MTAVVGGLLLAALLFWLERWSCAHSLDDVQGLLETEDFLTEAGEPVQLTLTVRNNGPHGKSFLALRLHLGREMLPCETAHLTKDRVGPGYTARCTIWLRPHQEASFSIPVKIERRGRYVLEPLQVIGGDFLGLKEQSRTEHGFHELIVPPKECDLPELGTMVGGFLGSVSVNRYLYEDPILTAGYREYTTGDPMRSISWKQSARGRGLMVKKIRLHDRTARRGAGPCRHRTLHSAAAGGAVLFHGPDGLPDAGRKGSILSVRAECHL